MASWHPVIAITMSNGNFYIINETLDEFTTRMQDGIFIPILTTGNKKILINTNQIDEIEEGISSDIIPFCNIGKVGKDNLDL